MPASGVLAICVAIGTALGVATGNIGLWLPIGVAIGAAFAANQWNRPKSGR